MNWGNEGTGYKVLEIGRKRTTLQGHVRPLSRVPRAPDVQELSIGSLCIHETPTRPTPRELAEYLCQSHECRCSMHIVDMGMRRARIVTCSRTRGEHADLHPVDLAIGPEHSCSAASAWLWLHAATLDCESTPRRSGKSQSHSSSVLGVRSEDDMPVCMKSPVFVSVVDVKPESPGKRPECT